MCILKNIQLLSLDRFSMTILVTFNDEKSIDCALMVIFIVSNQYTYLFNIYTTVQKFAVT